MLIVVGCGLVILVVHVIRRGRIFVRSVDYLQLLDSGATVKDANRVSAVLFSSTSDPDYIKHAIHRARTLSDMYFEGKQVPIIRLARSRGFNG